MSRIVRIHEYGNASVLKIENLEVPAPASDEVQIAVKAIGINRAEVMFRNHAYLQEAEFPSRLGYEAAGVVSAIGSGVKDINKGDAVSIVPPLDIARWGTYGEVVNVPARLVVKHAKNLSFEKAAAVWMQYVTAWGALVDYGKLTKGDFLIVTAASSSVALAAIQIARMVGAIVIASTRTSNKRQALIDAGAHHVVAVDEEDIVQRVMEITGGVGARLAFDPVVGPSFDKLAASLARGGTLIQYGALSPEPTPFPPFTVLGKSLTLRGYLYSEVVSDDAALERAKDFINGGLESGALAPLIAKIFRLDQIQEAHLFLESNTQVGKVIVTV
ncbi:zinc-dependent alcohol dehydrogenase family protein [Undibacterium sp. TJN25]|uniref:zinc-dependent alcohol dehydrogenase family protein n=1 Tax=Undibacterium sp. TJN25 TaxID=3413056 RepID=UPI003BF1D3FD